MKKLNKKRKLEHRMVAVGLNLGHPTTLRTPEIHAVYWNGVKVALVALEVTIKPLLISTISPHSMKN